MALPPIHLFSEIYRIHGHRCPMSTLGGRLGFAARERLFDPSPMSAVYFIDTCAADGIGVMTGCKKEDKTLRIVAKNRHALWLKGHQGRGVFAELSGQAMTLAGEYRARDLALAQVEGTLSPEVLTQRRAEKELFLDELLQKLWSLPDEELMDFATTLPVDLCCEND